MTRSLYLLPLVLLGACAAPELADDEGTFDLDLDLLQPEDYHPTTVLVGVDGKLPDRVFFRDRELPRIRQWESLGVLALEASGADVLDVVRELRESGEYLFVEPDLVRTVSWVPSDPFYAYQWHFEAVNAPAAWDVATGTGVVVAVIDTGVTSGPLDGLNALATGYDFVNLDADAADDNGHGTHVAGTIAGATNNGAGVAGLAFGATILPVKVLDAAGSGYSSDVIDGIIWAADNGADVINMSLGSRYGSTAEQTACNYAEAAGVFVTAAAGNAGRRLVEYPAGYSSVVGVAATDYRDVRSWYSNRGSHVELAAPGGDTSRDDNLDGYADGVLQETFEAGSWGFHFFQGTSMATPHVAAAAALLSGLGATNTEIRSTLAATAVDLGSAGWDQEYGYGLIDAAAAVAAFTPAAPDVDGDGWTTTGGDCDDTNAAVHPGATETWYDGVDQDCDGASDYDADGDGFDAAAYGGTDCDDTNAAVHPGATEVCNGLDDDCDGLTDDADAGLVADTWYRDADGDGYGDAATSATGCTAPAGYVADATDCDDAAASVNPGATDICEDGVDQDCSGADATCSTSDVTPPVISGVSWASSRYLTVSWTTDEPTTGLLCNDKGECATTTLGTSHSAQVGKRADTFTITATDAAGNVSTYGPQAF